MARTNFVITILLLLSGLLSTAFAEPPEMVNYQGMLTDSVGEYINGNYDLTFRIYAGDQPDAVILWTETHYGVSVELGLFNVILGSTTPVPADLFVGVQRWLGVTVAGDDEMDPRMRITSVPWALRAAVADSALNVGGGDADSVDVFLLEKFAKVAVPYRLL